MDVRRQTRRWCARLAAATTLALLTGCAGFFPPIDNSGGGSSGGGTTPTDVGDIVYVANSTTSTITGYSIASGKLTQVSGATSNLPAVPSAMVITPSNSFLYVAVTGGIYGYSIASGGALTALNGGGAEAITLLGAASMDVSPDGNWLFALDGDGTTIDEYQINTSTGALSAVANPTYTALNNAAVVPHAIRVAPNGQLVFVALGTGGDLVYTLNTSTGAIASSQALGLNSNTTSDNALAIDSNTSYLYIARSGTNGGLAVYTIGTNGALSSITGSPFATGNGAYSVVLDSTGKYVYTANRADGTLSGFSIGTGSALTALPNSPYASGSLVSALARDNSGSYILAGSTGGSPDLTLYGFDSTNLGALNNLATTTTGKDPTGPVAIVTTH